jgi:hypothetical protein
MAGRAGLSPGYSGPTAANDFQGSSRGTRHLVHDVNRPHRRGRGGSDRLLHRAALPVLTHRFGVKMPTVAENGGPDRESSARHHAQGRAITRMQRARWPAQQNLKTDPHGAPVSRRFTTG